MQAALDKAPAHSSPHPRAVEPNRPDADSLMNDLAGLEESLNDASLPGDERSRLRDRLSLLAQRSAWLADDKQRGWTKERIDALWKRFEDRP